MNLQKYITNEEIQHCRYCQWEIFPGQKILVTWDNSIFDRYECIKGRIDELKKEDRPSAQGDIFDMSDPQEFVLSYNPNLRLTSRRK